MDACLIERFDSLQGFRAVVAWVLASAGLWWAAAGMLRWALA